MFWCVTRLVERPLVGAIWECVNFVWACLHCVLRTSFMFVGTFWERYVSWLFVALLTLTGCLLGVCILGSRAFMLGVPQVLGWSTYKLH